MMNRSLLSYMEKLLVDMLSAFCGRGENRTQYPSACESNALCTKLSCPPNIDPHPIKYVCFNYFELKLFSVILMFSNNVSCS
jgi:hypothetical protein